LAGVARAFALNDNLIDDWRRGPGGAANVKTAGTALPEPPPGIVAVTLPRAAAAVTAAAARAAEEIRLEFKRGATGVSVRWPFSAATDCAAWLREVLQ